VSPRFDMRSRARDPKALPVILFGGLLVLLFAGFAVAQGIGKPDPSGDVIAIVEEAPEEAGEITQEDFDRALEQAAARSNIQSVPEPGSRQYEELKEVAMGDLLDTVWIQGEAAEQDVTVSERQVEQQLGQIKTQNFRTEKEYRQFLETSGFTQQDVNLRVELQLLSDDLQKQVSEGAPPVTQEQIEEYYEGAQEQFELPATRDVRLILNRDRAKVEQAREALEADDSVASWRKVAKQYSTDLASKSNGGLRPGLTEGLVEEPLNSEIFAASEGEISEPVKTPLGFYVFQVETIEPARTQELSEVRQQIKTQLEQTAEQEAFTTFIDDYGSKWQTRTFCADDFIVERCANFEGTGRPETAPASCYEEDPRRPPEACPAPVVALQPALPGTISVLTPQGQRLPQRPIPAGLTPLPEGGQPLPGAVPGLPPGAAPTP
jgi:foldase protein PrsA